MRQATDIYVLDTSVWLTLIEDEAGADQVQELLFSTLKEADSC
jgi:hypothetical protein